VSHADTWPSSFCKMALQVPLNKLAVLFSQMYLLILHTTARNQFCTKPLPLPRAPTPAAQPYHSAFLFLLSLFSPPPPPSSPLAARACQGGTGVLVDGWEHSAESSASSCSESPRISLRRRSWPPLPHSQGQWGHGAEVPGLRVVPRSQDQYTPWWGMAVLAGKGGGQELIPAALRYTSPWNKPASSDGGGMAP
jgi:hypothetical protein